MKITNKPLFWTGLAGFIVPLAIAGCFGISMLDWTWLTGIVKAFLDWFNLEKIKYFLIAVFVILYVALFSLLIKFGLQEEKK